MPACPMSEDYFQGLHIWDRNALFIVKTKLENTLSPLEQNDQQMNKHRCMQFYPVATMMSEEMGCNTSFCSHDIPEQRMPLDNDGVWGRNCYER